MDIKIWIFLLLFGFLKQNAFGEYAQDNIQTKYFKTEPYTQQKDYNNWRRYRYNTSNILTKPVTKTEFGFQTVKSGSVLVQPGQKVPVNVIPDERKTQYYFVTKNRTTFQIPPPTAMSTRRSFNTVNLGYRNNNSTRSLMMSTSSSPHPSSPKPDVTHRRRQHHRHNHRRSRSDCIRCPPEKVIIARKGLDGVFVDVPNLMSCYNRPLSNNIYGIETLFGPEFKFLLPHGTHSLHAKIKNKRNGHLLQTCILRYKVVVQQCGRFYPQNDNLRIKCDLGYIWGSKCYFSCRTGHLSHHKPVVCGDSLKWEGNEPECLPTPMRDRTRPCDFLVIPDNGRFACEYPKELLDNINSRQNKNLENELLSPEGSICRIVCNDGYKIPPTLTRYSTLRCQNGRWNSTISDLCRRPVNNY